MAIKRQNTIKSEGAMSSMTDLVFLLLIFFIILSTMASTGIEVKVPRGKNQNNVPSDNVTLLLYVCMTVLWAYVLALVFEAMDWLLGWSETPNVANHGCWSGWNWNSTYY